MYESVEMRDKFVLLGSCRFLSSVQAISSHLISSHFFVFFSPAKSAKHRENSASTERKERHYGGRGAQAHGVSRVADQRS